VPSVDRVEFRVDGALAGVARKAPWSIAHDFGTSLVAHKVEATVYANGFRTVERASVMSAAMTANESINVDLVEVPLRVRSAKALTRGDVRVRENGVEQTVRDVRSDRGPAQFVFIVDRSLSMGGGRLDAALRAIDAETRSLRPDDSVSIILFNHNVARARSLARGESAAMLFGDVVPSGGTSLRDAVASMPRAARTYAVVLGAPGPVLRRAASTTGGAIAEAERDTLARRLHELIADINSRYTLVYQSSAAAPGWRSIEVRAARAGIALTNARKGYFAQ
jgi:hypothetical protein